MLTDYISIYNQNSLNTLLVSSCLFSNFHSQAFVPIVDNSLFSMTTYTLNYISIINWVSTSSVITMSIILTNQNSLINKITNSLLIFSYSTTLLTMLFLQLELIIDDEIIIPASIVIFFILFYYIFVMCLLKRERLIVLREHSEKNSNYQENASV